MRRKPHIYRRILSVLLIFTMIAGGTLTASASNKIDDAKEKREEAQEQLNKVNKEIEALEREQNALQAKMEAYDEALIALLTDLTLLEEDITDKQSEIDAAKEALEAAQLRENEQYEAMKLRIQYMYENGDASVWTAMADADGMSEVLNRVEYINSVYDYDRNQLTEYQNTVQEVKDLSLQLELDMIEMEELQMNMQEQQQELEALIAESNAKLEGFASKLTDATKLAKEYARTIKKQNQIIIEEEARLEAEKNANAGNGAGSGTVGTGGAGTGAGNTGADGSAGGANPSYSTNVNGQDVVNYACQFVGNPYVFGGTSLTNGSDCSYFVMACFGNFGISLPRTSYGQRSCGQAVSYANAKAGDIICYAGHVAIYMGNGKIVHAANKRLGICYGNATYRTIVSVRRVL